MKTVPSKMTAQEKRAASALASLYAFRMLGLFLLFPVFSVLAPSLVGGSNSVLKGLALGAYGITQAIFLIPLGYASDKWGRKPVVVGGLLLFLIGTVVCMMASSIEGVIVGRAIQGAGAVSAAISAWLADSVRPEVRARAMAMVGSSIGLSFAASLVIAPVLAGLYGLQGLFFAMAVLGAVALGIAWKRIPEPSQIAHQSSSAPSMPSHLKTYNIWCLNVGVFAVHACLMALFLLIPHWILELRTDWQIQDLWKVYLPVIAIALVVMVVLIVFTERRKKHISILQASGFFLAATIVGFAWIQHSFWGICILLSVFFVFFNVVEALQPSLIARMVSSNVRGQSMGVYNVCQSLGVFFGAFIGGKLMQHYSPTVVVMVLSGILLLWSISQLRMRLEN